MPWRGSQESLKPRWSRTYEPNYQSGERSGADDLHKERYERIVYIVATKKGSKNNCNMVTGNPIRTMFERSCSK